MKILVAGVGNVLWRDDGFGVEVAHRLQSMAFPPEVKVVETGIGGIHLVQELLAGYDALIVIDAVDHGRPPGTLMVIIPDVEDVHQMPDAQKYDYLADMHYTKPEKALMLARALKILPKQLLMVGIQPVDTEAFERGLTAPVAAAVELAIAEVLRLVDEMLSHPPSADGSPSA
ncbi:MAG: hydrogenase maturation protease [Actinomycetota bacterium]